MVSTRSVCAVVFMVTVSAAAVAAGNDGTQPPGAPQIRSEDATAESLRRGDAYAHLVAAGLALGTIGIGEVAGVDDARVLALAARIQGAARDGVPEGWAQITVRRTDGRTATLEGAVPSGSPERPLSDAQLQAKFHDCAAHAVRPIPTEAVERAMNLVYHLDAVADARDVLHLVQV